MRSAQIQQGYVGPLMAHLPTCLLEGGLMRQSGADRRRHGQFLVAPAGKTVAEGMRSAKRFAGSSGRGSYCFGIGTHGDVKLSGYSNYFLQFRIQFRTDLNGSRFASLGVRENDVPSFFVR